MIDGIRRLVRRWFTPALSSYENNRFALFSPDESVVMVYALEVSASSLAPALESLKQKFRRSKVVFVVTDLDTRPFMDNGVIFEQFPALEQIAAQPDLMNWTRYLQDRHALLLSKWTPGNAIAYGIGFEGYLAKAGALIQTPLTSHETGNAGT